MDTGFTTESVIVLETSLDHITGEEAGMALSFLNESPAVLDAIMLSGIGKKNRPVNFLQVLCYPEDEQKACEEIFRHTHALGIRSTPTKRHILKRYPETATIAGYKVTAKAHVLEEKIYIRPEADEIAKLAQSTKTGAPGLRWLKQDNTPE